MDSDHGGDPWRELGDGGTRQMVHRCPALRPEAHPYSGPFQGFFESYQKHSTRLSEAAGTDCEPNRSAVLAKRQLQRAAERRSGRILQTTMARSCQQIVAIIVMIIGNGLLFCFVINTSDVNLFTGETMRGH